MNSDTLETRTLTVRYWIALFLIALLSVSTYVAIRVILGQQLTDAPAINLSGRQRMLSQKLTKEVLLYVQPQYREKQRQYHQLIVATMATWQQVHEGLQEGNRELGLPGKNSQEIRNLFVEMNPHYETIISSVERLLAMDIANSTPPSSQVDSVTENIVNASPAYLKWMDAVVLQYENEAQIRVNSLKDYELLIVAAMLFVLLLEARFIFEPMVDGIRENYQKLKHQSDELHDELLKREQAERARENLEKQLRHLQKLEAVGQLTGGIAHDFNNLLGVIMGNIELVKDVVGDQESRALLDNALEGARRGASLTAQLLSFSRKQTLCPTSFDLNQLLQDMHELLQRTLGETIEIETVCHGGLWTCFIDKSGLESAVLNLVINARDAMPGGGNLTIETANVYLDDIYAETHAEVSAGQYVMLAVSDTGTGMSQETKERAFEPFYTTKEVGRGSGLGLSMVFGFVKQSQGHVNIYSEQEQGTCIKFYLPRHLGQEQQEPAGEKSGALSSGDETILVVEDNPALLKLLIIQLENLGYAVLSAEDANAALEVVDVNEGIDLLLTDLGLPGGLSGHDLAKQIRQHGSDMKILYMSGYAQNAATRNGYLDRDAVLLRKPFEMATLAKKLRNVLDG